MGESHDFMSLDWVHSDIEDTLAKAQESLEAYLSDTSATDQLQVCGEAVHQVHGSLQMAGLASALMLTEEIQAMLTGLAAGEIEDASAAHEALVQALVHLPPYLTRVQHETVERPLLLLGPANQLRKQMGREAISDFSYFTPDLGPQREPAGSEVQERFEREDSASLKKIRQIFQFALVGLIRNEDVQVNLGRVSNALARLQQLCKGAPVNQGWEVGTAFIEGLLNGAIELESAIIDLLRRIDLAIKTLIEAGATGLDTRPDENMLKGLLYHLAKSPAGMPRVDAIKQDYQLDQYDLGTKASAATLIAAPDKQTIESVVSALTEELQRVKDTIDLYVRNDVKGSLDLGGLQPSLSQIASTLVLLNLEAPRIIVQEQISMLADGASDNNEIDEDALLKIAEALLYVEAELDSLLESVTSRGQDSVGVHANAAAETVVEESLKSLRKAKDCMHDFLASDGDFSLLDQVPGQLRGTYGGLSILSLPTAPQLVFACGQYIEDDIIASEKIPEGAAIETLAEVIATVEFYLEGFTNSHVFNENVLTQAKQGIASLGYPIVQADGISSEDDHFGVLDEELSGFESATDELGADLYQELDHDLEQEPEQAVAAAQNSDDVSYADSAEPSASIEPSADEVGDNQIGYEAVAEAEAPIVAEAADDENFIDDEILEIFVEEAQEVFEQIDIHWPLYASDFGNQDSLKEVRRAFHTLKGSGRMVGAGQIGELAWSVESMLNQLLEGVVSPNDSICGLVNRVTGVMPGLLEDFRTQTESSFDIGPLMTCAELLSKGEAAELPDIESEAQHETTEAIEFAEVDSVDDAAAEPTFVVEESASDDPEGNADSDIYTIFGREAGQHLAAVDDFLSMAEHGSAEITDELYRALHTLKGSAHMAELPNIAGVASAAEALIKSMRERAIWVDSEVAGLLVETGAIIRGGLEHLHDDPLAPLAGSSQLLEKLDAYSAHRLELLGEADAVEAPQTSALALLLQQNMDPICIAQSHFETWQADPQPGNPVFAELRDASTRLVALLAGTDDASLPVLLHALDDAYAQLSEFGQRPNEALLAALGDAHEGLINGLDQAAAGQDIEISIVPVQQLADAIERLQSSADEASDEVAEEITEEFVEELAEEITEESAEEVAEDITGDTSQSPGQEALDQELVGIFLEEAEEIFEAVATAKQDWLNDNSNAGAIDALQRALHTLKGSSRMAGLGPVGDLSHELEAIYEDVAAARINAGHQLFELIHACDDRLADMVAEVKGGAACTPAPELIERARAFHAEQLGQPIAATESATSATEVSETVVFDTALGVTVEADSEALGAFFDNAAGLLASLGKSINKLKSHSGKKANIYKHLQADVTSLKDVAYVAGVHEIGDLSQIFLEVLINFEPADLGEDAVQVELSDWLERLAASYQEARESAQGVIEPEPQVDDVVDASHGQPAQVPAQDTVRVSSSLLEQLVNLGGETSVSRSRIEQQVSNFGYAIEEVGVTIERLREQLRRMEIETEAQILFRQEQEGPEHEGFDPLEMDRYSRMQELSRSLVESVSDLFDLKDTLRDRARYTETILLQQARINTELQEGLMKTRMVPFSRLAARLRRVVRQVGQEVSKQVEFTLKNVDVELDRSLLEHMTAPLEHMLRNAVDHGIESPAQRKQAGKDEKGSVQLSLGRDGGDVVLELSDDGAGVDIASVRAKAVERGLIEQGAQLTDDEILQFILHAGFSTARKVTQISGRGVGMDVVSSEIKKLGGTITIHSEPGQGSRFVVRVPFTVSVNSALMVNIGDETFALPLSTIEGVVRVSPYELEEYYRDNGPRFEYAGQQYDLSYLGEFVGHRNNLQAQNQAMPLPVILIRTAEGSVALQVDDITSSREIVVKPLGSQLGAMPGLSGATILGDGRVVLILDMPAMVRARAAVSTQEKVEFVETAEQVSTELRVMVVDDSVTVRKVASRLLERHGMEVIVAKDGVEAMTKLQDTLPSVMLLDIEMPRMDGFELASLMRHDERMKDVPIVMITSRTGDKHRERAMEIGVNRFMGKPFQEDDLLDAIGALTNFERDQHKRSN